MSIQNLNLNTYKCILKVTKADKSKYGEIYTPLSLVENMLNMLCLSNFSDSSAKSENLETK